ncbi:hypothetical protein [Flavobacterium sp. 3HN19-14]|uniref:hypothetical protein n=1 Tax=Flavobacterium sp. 3HN19-14 TaxID=3448133 RepID=UPI003EE13E27
MILKYINPEIVYLNDCGNVFYGFENMHENNRFFTTFESIKVLERNIKVFNNVAVVTTLEARAGHYFDVAFAQNYRISRIWKLHTTGWKVIAATAVAI